MGRLSQRIRKSLDITSNFLLLEKYWVCPICVVEFFGILLFFNHHRSFISHSYYLLQNDNRINIEYA